MAIEIHVQPPRKRRLRGFFPGYKWRITVTDDGSGETLMLRIHGAAAPRLSTAQAQYTATLVDVAREYPTALVGRLDP